MPPRYAYWTILVDDQPTAFRSGSQEDLMPTFNRLKEKHASAMMMWFQNGKLWPSRLDAQEAMRARGEMGRRGDSRKQVDRLSRSRRVEADARASGMDAARRTLSTPPSAAIADDKLDWKPKGEFAPAPKRADRRRRSPSGSQVHETHDCEARAAEAITPARIESRSGSRRAPSIANASRRPKLERSCDRDRKPDWKPKGSFDRDRKPEWKPKGSFDRERKPEWKPKGSFDRDRKPEWKPKGSVDRDRKPDWKPKGSFDRDRQARSAKPEASTAASATSPRSDEKLDWTPKSGYTDPSADSPAREAQVGPQRGIQEVDGDRSQARQQVAPWRRAHGSEARNTRTPRRRSGRASSRTSASAGTRRAVRRTTTSDRARRPVPPARDADRRRACRR